MKILGIECSGKVAAVALSDGDYVQCEISLDGQLTHSQIIMPMLEECLLRGNVGLDEVDAIACNIGPGSFTGIRIGCSTANGLALATGKKLVAVHALESLAYNVAEYKGYTVPVLDARADRLYAGIYHGGKELVAPMACTVGELCQSLPGEGELLFLGEGAELHFDAFFEKTQGRAVLAPMHLRRHRGGTLAALARGKLERGETVPRCIPMYLRASQAEQEKRKAVH